MSKERVQQQITPKQLFDEKGLLGLGLAEEFAKTRWEVENGVVKFSVEKEARYFGRNAGAIEVITEDNKVFRSHAFSQPGIYKDQKAHTERILMREALDDLMPANFPEGGIRRPSEMAKEPPVHFSEKGKQKKN